MQATARFRETGEDTVIDVDPDETIGTLRTKLIAALIPGAPPAAPELFTVQLRGTGQPLGTDPDIPLSDLRAEDGLDFELCQESVAMRAPAEYGSSGDPPPFAVSRSGNYIAAVSTGILSLFDAATSHSLWETPASATLIAFAPGEGHIAGADGPTVPVWSTDAGTLSFNLTGHKGAVAAIAFTRCGGQVVSAGLDDKSLRVWCLSTGTQVSVTYAFCIRHLAVAEAHILTTRPSKHVVCLWSLSGGTCQKYWKGHTGEICEIRVSECSTMALTCSGDHSVRVWSVPSGNPLQVLRFTSLCTSAAFAPVPCWVVARLSDGVAVTDLVAGREVPMKRSAIPYCDEGRVEVSRCGGYVVWNGSDGVSVMRLEAGDPEDGGGGDAVTEGASGPTHSRFQISLSLS